MNELFIFSIIAMCASNAAPHNTGSCCITCKFARLREVKQTQDLYKSFENNNKLNRHGQIIY